MTPRRFRYLIEGDAGTAKFVMNVVDSVRRRRSFPYGIQGSIADCRQSDRSLSQALLRLLQVCRSWATSGWGPDIMEPSVQHALDMVDRAFAASPLFTDQEKLDYKNDHTPIAVGDVVEVRNFCPTQVGIVRRINRKKVTVDLTWVQRCHPSYLRPKTGSELRVGEIAIKSELLFSDDLMHAQDNPSSASWKDVILLQYNPGSAPCWTYAERSISQMSVGWLIRHEPDWRPEEWSRFAQYLW